MMLRLTRNLLPASGSSGLRFTSFRAAITHYEFREKLGLPSRLNRTRELQEYKDYSFNDGRVTPVTPGQLKKIKIQRDLAASAVRQLKEIKFIQNRHSMKVQGRLDEKQHIINSKLKPKGDALANKSKKSSKE
ncbi:39S ribosomal protein L52, mitochondrial-like [Thrips palmi]|uniref:Large ribosomal subunit protein mL52 n=1 Tax=Thrips palmi TaxID=161013 RepID=A0A6P8ZXE5_THRPL|nr:39S ribosomal protein L52, mitochondrial-like [Thrips palmi]